MIDLGIFSDGCVKKVQELIDGGFVRNITFSHFTYQIEVVDDKNYWILLQVDDSGNLIDKFCTCEMAESTTMCSHLAAGMEIIFRGGQETLHMRFELSIWNKLFRLIADRIDYSSTAVKRNGDEYFCKIDDQIVFLLKLKNDSGREKAKELIDNRKEETEETSLKFSNLDLNELELWRNGKPSDDLRYELSFWSDLAKWGLILEERGEECFITFKGNENSLPTIISLSVNEFEVEISIDKKDWPKLIEPLSKYDADLKVFPFKDIIIDKIVYDEYKKEFLIYSESLDMKKKDAKIVEWEDWIFCPEIGFFPRRNDEMLCKDKINKEQIPLFLQKYSKLIVKYIENVTIHNRPKRVSYSLAFNDNGDLCIEAYLFNRGDIKEKNSCFYGKWAYLDGDGFYQLSDLLFDSNEKIIPKAMVSEFIDRNKLWLNKYEDFKIHITNIESKLTYKMNGNTLEIEGDKTFLERGIDIIDFDKWIYMKGEGFFSKKSTLSQRRSLVPQKVLSSDISNFIHENKEDLEQIKGFFISDSGLEKSGLIINLDRNRSIRIEPYYKFKSWANSKGPIVFDDFIYLQNEGFAEIPDRMKIPKKYTHEVVITSNQLLYFVNQEMVRIHPYIIHLDNRLVKPDKLYLNLKSVKRYGKGWMMELAYVSSNGEVRIKDVYDAIVSFSQFMLSNAGLLDLKEKRFHYLTRVDKDAFYEDGKYIYLSTLDWLRLSVLEDVHLPQIDTIEDGSEIDILSKLQCEHSVELPDLNGLKSKLRPYQEVGVRWLWFLYTYGLSGFLCDEMGLGKTHQAMALIVAAMNVKKNGVKPKFIIVCPTSVIYHWQDLLEVFLKKAKVLFYHGPLRISKNIKLKYDIILTTYGIVRSDKELFSKEKFEIAIFDEMQMAKNSKSQIHKSLKMIDAEMKLALTGTPMENHLLELKSLFDIILPNFLPPMNEFKDEFIYPIEKHGDGEKKKTLSYIINPFILRRKKQDVLDDLPDKIEEIAYVGMSEEQKELYCQMVNKTKNLVTEEGREFYMHVFALLNYLKQVCDHPALISGNISGFETHESGKWELFVDLLEESRASGQKLVVFSQYLHMLDIIELYLKRENILYATIRGSTRDRKQQMHKFQTDPKCEVFVGSLQAAGVGIDLTAASVVIHYDRWWNPAKENQATDRVHRIGQNRGVSVFKLVTKDTVEEHIHFLIEKKRGLIENIIGYDDENDLKTINREELVHLLNQIYKDVK